MAVKGRSEPPGMTILSARLLIGRLWWISGQGSAVFGGGPSLSIDRVMQTACAQTSTAPTVQHGFRAKAWEVPERSAMTGTWQGLRTRMLLLGSGTMGHIGL